MQTALKGLPANEKNMLEIPFYWQIVYARLSLKYGKISDTID